MKKLTKNDLISSLSKHHFILCDLDKIEDCSSYISFDLRFLTASDTKFLFSLVDSFAVRSCSSNSDYVTVLIGKEYYV